MVTFLNLVSYAATKDKMDEVLRAKKGDTALVIYAPPNSIPRDELAKLDTQLNVMVSNFRGRLLNDIMVCLMTTGYR